MSTKRSKEERPILVVGSTGQIGRELLRALPASDVLVASREDLDLTRPDSIRRTVRRVHPRAIVNAAGYTAVDRAESDRDLCFAVNAEGPGVLAEESKACSALMVHYSTDYVFDGAKTTPYVETDAPAPLNVYGESKLAGERAVQAVGGTHLVLRTSWIYGPHGTNFVRTILRLARERRELRVVNDQTGTPTSTRAIAVATSQLLDVALVERDLGRNWSGLYHMAAAGSTTWYELARTVLADDRRVAEQQCERLVPISTAEYPTPARRPRYSVLGCAKIGERFAIRLAGWREALAPVLSELAS